MHATPLYRHYGWFSLTLMLACAVVLGYTVVRFELQQLETLAQERNATLTQVLRNVHAADIAGMVNPSTAADAPQVAAFTAKVRAVLQDADIAKLKIYDLRGRTVFSTDPSQIGEDQSSNIGFLTARTGQVASELTHRDQFSATEQSLSDVDMVTSYVPVVQNGRVMAVFELYQNVTALTQRMAHALWKLGAVLLVVFGGLYAVLLAWVRRSTAAEQRQKIQLAHANTDLDQRVAQRTLELRLSKARLRSLTMMSSDFFWETDAQHRFTMRTPSLRETQSEAFDPSALIGVLCWDIPHTSPDVPTWAAHRQLLQAHHPFRGFEVGRMDAHGQTQYVSVSGDPVFASDGTFMGYRGVGTDITERKRAESELRIAAAAFDSQQSTMVTDAQAVILRVNTAFERDTGYCQAEVVGQTPRLLQSGRHDQNFYRDMWKTLLCSGQWHGEVWDRRKDGAVYPKWLTIAAVKNGTGAITHFVGTHVDISERKAAEQRIAELAFFDALTRLPNRTLFHDRLRVALAGGQRAEHIGAVLLIDLDHFKTINDTLGHPVGDLLLQQMATRLQTCVREGETLARLGGDEFAVLVSHVGANVATALPAVEALGQRMLAQLAPSFSLGAIEYPITASIGATLFGLHSSTAEEVLQQAELAMYRAKEQGRNRLRFFDPEMQTQMLESAEVERSLRRAIAEGQLLLHYQAFVNKDKRVSGAEALVRWQHPVQGLIPPGEFIPVAESSGLIVPLGQWVLETACQQLALWAQHPVLHTLTLSVNVSARQFHQADFTDQVIATLQRSGANPARLKLELTESLLVDHLDEVIAKMGTLRAIGLQFALDDFGTGYSSLAYLSRLPLDQLKIDRSFVSCIETDDRSVAICSATIGLAHILGLHVVAEGVETEAQRYFLSTVHHCDYLQGYLLSRPVALADFEHLACAAGPH